MNICICICTRQRRSELEKLLDSINDNELYAEENIRIVVVENDSENISEDIVKGFSLRSRFRVEYFLEPEKGLVTARNRSVKEAGNVDFCCFVDDDETVSATWLKELQRCQNEFNADAVAGPIIYVTDDKTSTAIKGFYIPPVYSYGTQIDIAFTGCLLIRKSCLDKIEGPFDSRLNFTGGEDIFLTSQLTANGGSIRFNPDATAFEIVSDERKKIKYIAKRSIRNAYTTYYVKYLREGQINKLKIAFRMTLRFGLGLLLIGPYLLIGGRNALKGLIKICEASGGFAFVLGRRNNFYGS
jgi:succinoglycan biosynthesis protein ExoM